MIKPGGEDVVVNVLNVVGSVVDMVVVDLVSMNALNCSEFANSI